jgi:ABC-type multidrug transport system ATPase subunit
MPLIPVKTYDLPVVAAPETMSGGDLLRIDGLARSFGSKAVVSSLDLAVGRGKRVAFRGPNGSGKSTVLRCIAGTLAPTSGRVSVAGHEAGSQEARRLIGVSLSQERSFYLRLSGRDNLLFYARLRGRNRAAASRRVAELGEELELADILATRADRCSTGMIQQLAFARALLGEPDLLVLDEPTRSLDRDAVARLWGAIDRRPDTAVVIATHLEADVERCDNVVEFPVA